jgi:hypothetical protein
MAEPTKPAAALIPAAVCVSVAAVLFAGLGGLFDEPWRTPFGVGVALCGAVLLVFWIIASVEGPLSTGRRLSWAIGALVGLCYALFFVPGEGLVSLLLHTGGGALLTRVAHWGNELRSPSTWDRD